MRGLGRDALNELRLTRSHYEVFVICTLLVLIDGYDSASLTYAAPAMVGEINLPSGLLGPLFAAHLVGMVLGSGPSGLIADRRGRRPTILGATAVFGVFTLLTATASSFFEILVLRLLTGAGLGAAVSNIIAMVSEASPRRCRATVVSIVYSALPLGALVGGCSAVLLIRAFGWRSIFAIGGGLSLTLLMAASWRLPESVLFLRSTDGERGSDAPTKTGSPMRDLFVGGKAVGTLLLWLTFFVNQLVVYFMFMWMPIVFKSRGLDTELGIIASASLNLGGVVGSWVLARLIDARGAHKVLTASYVAAFLLVSAFGSVVLGGATVVLVTVVLTGFILNGSNVSLAAVATSLYPTQSRSTGVGWAIGIGRLGAITGSLVGAVLLRSRLPLDALYPLVGSSLLLAALCMRAMPARNAAIDAPPAGPHPGSSMRELRSAAAGSG
jgi:AAHS family 4-hydroxybenzoate transporter-like MFS transporter